MPSTNTSQSKTSKSSTQSAKAKSETAKSSAPKNTTTKGRTPVRKIKVPSSEVVEKALMEEFKEIVSPDYYGDISIMQKLKSAPLEQLFEESRRAQQEEEVDLIIEDQYKEALELLLDADAAGLYPVLVGPPGVGKTALCRYFTKIRGKLTGNDTFEWMTFDEATRPSHLIGSFNPALTINKGFIPEAFNFGPLSRAMLRGGVFLANEINRATEFTQNTLLEPLEERSINIPHLGRLKANVGFFFIAAMNPSEIAGTHRIADALKDRLKVWIELDYPRKITELRIIKKNNPYYELGDAYLERIYAVIKATREDNHIEIPASLRAGIAMAKLGGLLYKKGKKEDFTETLANIAYYVISGSIKPKPGADAKQITRRIIKEQLGVELK